MYFVGIKKKNIYIYMKEFKAENHAFLDKRVLMDKIGKHIF